MGLIELPKLAEDLEVLDIYDRLILVNAGPGDGQRSARNPDSEARCSGKRGKCGQWLANEWHTPVGSLVLVLAPGRYRTPDDLAAVRKNHGRLKMPAGVELRAALRENIPDGSEVVAWCHDHQYRTVDLTTMRDLGTQHL